MTTVFQQAVQLIAVALGFAFLGEFAAIAAFEPSEDLVWKLLMAIAFMYLAGRVPSMLGHHGTFDAWLHTLYFGMSLPGGMMRSARSIGLIAGGAAGGPAGAAAASAATGVQRRQQRGQSRRHHGRRSSELGGPELHRPGPERPHAQEPGAVAKTTTTTTQEAVRCASSRPGPTRPDSRTNQESEKENGLMDDLTQTISNLVGILLGLVGVVGVGYFIYGAYMYLTASGAPNQMERGKAAMMTALAGIVLALVAYGVVELVMNAVVGNPVDPTVPDPTGGDTGSDS